MLPNIEKAKNLTSSKSIDCGFVAMRLLATITRDKLASERQILEFRLDCRNILRTLVKRLQEKSPLKYGLVRNLTCLNPQTLKDKPDGSVAKFRNLLTSLVNKNQVAQEDCDDIISQLKQFQSFCIKSNCQVSEHLDKFYFDLVGKDARYQKLRKVVKKLLTLSHGQAAGLKEVSR